MTNLLARYAESIFWMARYMERAENLARILGVQEGHHRIGAAGERWFTIVRLNADEQRFAERYQHLSATNVVRFYTLDAENPTSIIAAVRAARENARSLRPWISTEMWTQLNVFHNHLLTLGPKDISLPNLARLCSAIKEACQLHAGITDGTFYQDEGWYYYLLGKSIERADQTTRLLDIEYHQRLPAVGGTAGQFEFVEWHAVLRSVAGYHAFRRIHPRVMTPRAVVDFMLFNDSFPRSVATCVRQLNQLLTRLKSRYKLRGGNNAMEQIDEIRAALDRPVERVLTDGLHDYLDWLQRQLSSVTLSLSADFFAHRPAVQPNA